MQDFIVSLRAAYQEFRRVMKRRAWMRKHRDDMDTFDLPF